MQQSTAIIGSHQAVRAVQLLNKATRLVSPSHSSSSSAPSSFSSASSSASSSSDCACCADAGAADSDGGIAFRHKWLDMHELSVDAKHSHTGKAEKLCKAALGYAFAAGTTDGPGEFDFVQGTNTTNPFWNKISNLLSKPSASQVACQSPKPILLNVGDINKLGQWIPHILPIQVFRLGRVFLLAVPGEFTTMVCPKKRVVQFSFLLLLESLFTQSYPI
jgi:hypothetical protein